LRREYTSETDSTLLPATSGATGQLDAGDREVITHILGHNYLARLFGQDELPPPPARIRQLLLADTDDPAQQELESGILTAAGRAVNHLHLRQPADLGRPAKIFRMVRPHQDELVLHLYPGVLGPLLAQMLPRQVGEGVAGIAGLRAKVHRRHVELYLIDAPTVTVLLSGVAFRQWTAALAFVDAALPPLGELRWRSNDPPPLTDAERFTLTTRHRAPGPAHLNSALLRRAGVFGGALWWRAQARGCETITVEWPTPLSPGPSVVHGPSLGRVARLLLHPLYGLPGDCGRLRYFDQDGLTVVDRDERRCEVHPKAGHAELVLRPIVPDLDDDVFDGHGWRGDGDPWREWDRALAAPNPSRPAG
jgi:hypothetical protein